MERFDRFTDEIRRAATAGVLMACHGLAIGAHAGTKKMLMLSGAVPLTMLLIIALALPPLYVGLSLVRAPITPSSLACIIARTWTATGALLGGLAPAVALLVVTNRTFAGTTAVSVFLVLAALLSVRRFFSEVRDVVTPASDATKGDVIVVASILTPFVLLLATHLFGKLVLPLVRHVS